MLKVTDKVFIFDFFKYIKVYYNIIFIYLYSYFYIINSDDLRK